MVKAPSVTEDPGRLAPAAVRKRREPGAWAADIDFLWVLEAARPGARSWRGWFLLRAPPPPAKPPPARGPAWLSPCVSVTSPPLVTAAVLDPEAAAAQRLGHLLKALTLHPVTFQGPGGEGVHRGVRGDMVQP